jgi:hypothetical protein
VERTVRIQLATGGVVLALGIAASIITSTVVASRAYERRGDKVQAAGRELSVRGSARQRIVSDQADWTVTVEGSGSTLAEAYAQVEAGEARVRKLLAEGGLAPMEVDAGAVQTSVRYKRTDRGELTNIVEAYELSRAVRVSSTKVDTVASLANEVTKLLKENVQVVSGAPRFSYTKLPELRVALAGQAAADARARAEELATKAGCVIVDVRTINSGPIQVTQPNSTDASSFGSYDTSTIQKDVWITVNAAFGVRTR